MTIELTLLASGRMLVESIRRENTGKIMGGDGCQRGKKMISDQDYEKSLSQVELIRFIKELEGWSESYTILSNALIGMDLHACIVARKEVRLGKIVDFTRSMGDYIRKSNYIDIRRHYFDIITGEESCNTVAVLNYAYSGKSADLSRVEYLGARIFYYNDDPIFLFDRSQADFLTIDSLRDNFPCPVIGLRASIRDIFGEGYINFASFCSIYCNIFDDENVIFLSRK